MPSRRLAGLLAVLIGLVPAIAAGDSQPSAAVPGLLVSRQLATHLHLSPGMVIRVSPDASGAGSQAFRVDGIYEPLPDPMRFAQQHFEVRLHLPDLLQLIGQAQDGDQGATVTAINIGLKDPPAAAAVARRLSARLPGTVVRPVDAPDDRTSTFVVIDRFHLAIAIVSVTGSAVFLLALMVMLVDERRETIAVLRLIGLTKGRLLAQTVLEGALITAAGTVAGILFALLAEGGFNRFFQWRYDTSLIFLRITRAVVGQSVLLALPLGIVASLLASWSFLSRRLLALIGR